MSGMFAMAAVAVELSCGDGDLSTDEVGAWLRSTRLLDMLSVAYG